MNDTSAIGNETTNPKEYVVEGIRTPAGLAYSVNHLWLHVDDDGSYHVGVDAFLAKVLGRVERISYITMHGVNRPAAAFTVNGVDVQVVFPNRMLLTGTNTYLRANLEKLSSDPYRAGWLFEGKDPKESSTAKDVNVAEGLIRDEKARQWMKQEVHRLSTFIHDQYSRQEGVMMDGGSFVDGVAHQLNRDELLHLFNEFFSPFAHWR